MIKRLKEICTYCEKFNSYLPPQTEPDRLEIDLKNKEITIIWLKKKETAEVYYNYPLEFLEDSFPWKETMHKNNPLK